MSDLISVIIPVYKVEKYLEKCVLSVINQTYKNIEIILVDDGSPDCSGQMCDKFADMDEQIKVIHKENGGLSDARNAGLEVARGEYIGFIDSDDWIEADMYESLLSALIETQSDIAICCINVVRKDRNFPQNIGHTRIFNGEKALYELINDSVINNYVVNRLYKAELFREVRFPKGRVFEDVLTMYRIFENISKAVYINKIGYNYLRREDSILGTCPAKLDIDFLIAHQERFMVLEGTHPELRCLLLKKYVEALWRMRSKFLSEDNNDLAYEIKKKISTFVLGKINEISKLENLSFYRRISFLFFIKYPWQYHMIYSMVKRTK